MDFRVRDLYKRFILVGRYYPNKDGKGAQYIRDKVKPVFFSNSSLNNEVDIKKAVGKGRYWVRELSAIATLAKYRDMKRKYGKFDE